MSDDHRTNDDVLHISTENADHKEQPHRLNLTRADNKPAAAPSARRLVSAIVALSHVPLPAWAKAKGKKLAFHTSSAKKTSKQEMTTVFALLPKLLYLTNNGILLLLVRC